MSIKLCAITTREMTMRCFFVDTLNYMSEHGFEITIICEPSKLVEERISSSINYIPIQMKSGIENPINALKAISQMIAIFKKNKYDIVQYASANAGLYASFAAKICRVPVRINCQWGFTYVGYEGIKRQVFRFIEKMICDFSTVVQNDSISNAVFAIREGIVSKEKSEIVWNGSSTGVDIVKFSPIVKVEKRDVVRNKLNIGKQAKVFGYIGRINKDKGIEELISAYKLIKEQNITNIALIIVGPMDDNQKFNCRISKLIKSDASIYYVGAKTEVIDFYATMDYFVLPSYREGIATVLLEAAAMGLPIVSTNINGSVDVVKDGINGYLCDAKSVDSLKNAMLKMLKSSEEKTNLMSENIRNLAVNCYSHDRLVEYIMKDRLEKYNTYKSN